MDIVQEIENGTVTVNYIRTLNIDEPLARIKSDGTVRYYQQDALGSVIGLTTESGQLTTSYSYDPYGNVTISGEASDNPFQYTGRENDGTGLYYYRARYYSPELQRFISEDPIGFNGGINFYRYVGNGPTRYIDPLGLLNILGGVGGSLVGITGVEGSVGQVCNTDAFKAATKGDLLGALGNVGYFGAVGGAIGQKIFPTIGMSNFNQVGFPRTWSGVTPRFLGGNAGSNAKAVFRGALVSGGVSFGGPAYVH